MNTTPRHIYYFKDYLIGRFGHQLYRIPVDLRLGCPHKTDERNGCIYCPEDGARAVHLHHNHDLKDQVAKGISYVKSRYGADKGFIAYFQSFTNTYADIDTLRKYYDEVLSLADFKMIMVSTRPDCLPDNVIDYLADLNERYEVWVELGVQTSNDRTLEIINRKHCFSDTVTAVKKLSAAGLKTSAHVIVGLPGETKEDFDRTVSDITGFPFNGIKFHNLQIVKNSYLGKCYFDKTTEMSGNRVTIKGIGSIEILNEYEYADILISLIRKIPSSWPVMRLIADAPAETMIQPKWQLSKGQFIELVDNTMQERKFYQGELSEWQMTNVKWQMSDSETNGRQSDFSSSYLKIRTDDGSFTFYNPVFRENYHTLAGATSEAVEKFIRPSNEIFMDKRNIRLLDIGFGLGYNAFAALKHAEMFDRKIEIISLELDASPLKLASSLHRSESVEWKILDQLAKSCVWENNENSIKILFGDARMKISEIPADKMFDLVFLDAFSTSRNPELWTYDFLRKIVKKLAKDSLLVTYSAAFPVRGALHRNRLFLGSTAPFGRIKGGTVASFSKQRIKTSLAEKDMNIILKSTAGLAYRDWMLDSESAVILERRNKTVHRLRRKGVPKWYTGN